MNKNEYLLDISYGCGLITEINGVIKETAPIFKWMSGKDLKSVIDYLKRKDQFNQMYVLKKENLCSK